MWVLVDENDNSEGARDLRAICGRRLPIKRWVAVAGERKHRVKRAARPSYAHRGSTKDVTKARAITYARWLAERDNIELPDRVAIPEYSETWNERVNVEWSSVVVPYKANPEPRVVAVYFDDVRVAIPNWDWVPTCTEETLELQLAA